MSKRLVRRAVCGLLLGAVATLPAAPATGERGDLLGSAEQTTPTQPRLEARGRITLGRLSAVVVGHTWAVRGRLIRTGARENKTVVVQWRDDGAWQRIGVRRRLDDGAYRLRFRSAAEGGSQVRAIVRTRGRTIDVSAVRTLTVLSETPQATPEPAQPGEAGPASDLIVNGGTQTMAGFLSAVMGDVHAYWARAWASAGWAPPSVGTYWPARGEAFYHACLPQGTYVEDTAASYCSANDYIVISQHMAGEIWRGAIDISGVPAQTAGDFSVAYVVGHEYGHNIQDELGWTPYRSQIRTTSWELHADCLAGNWMNSAYYSGRLQAGDVEEALAAARALGDWVGDHGTPEQRATAVWHGYTTGDPAACEGYIRQWW